MDGLHFAQQACMSHPHFFKSSQKTKIECLDYGEASEHRVRTEGEKRGLIWVASNVRYRVGEIDLVMIDLERSEWVFIEVRARRSRDWRTSLEWVSVAKLLKLKRAIELFLIEYASYPPAIECRLQSARIDLVAVRGGTLDQQLDWYENFSPI